MKLDVIGQRIEVTEALFAHAERRLQFALGRFGARIPKVTATVADLNGPRGGIDKRCRLIADVTPRGKVIVEVSDADVFIALDRAADRLGRAVARELERRREQAIRLPEVTRVPAGALFRQQSRMRREEGGLG